MAETPELWKQRYEFALDAAKRTEQDHRAQVMQLTRAVAQLSRGCEGQDPNLDEELASLRGFLKLKTLSTDVLASKIDVLEERLKTLRRRASGVDPALADAIGKLLDGIAAQNASRERVRSIELLRKELRSGGDPAGLITRAIVLLEVQESRSRPNGTASDARGSAGAQAPTNRGWLSALLGRWRKPAMTAQAADSSERRDGKDAPELRDDLGDPASKALDALIDTVPAPATEPELRRVYEHAKQRLSRGLRVQELVPSIDEVRVLASAALARGRDEFGLFLQQMNERLSRGSEAIDEGRAQAEARSGNAEELRIGVHEGMRELRESAAAATNLEELKQEVNRKVEETSSLIAQFHEREEQLLRDAAATAERLAAQVRELTEQAASAEMRIEEERRIALTDPLTHLPNREGWSRRLLEEYERWRRYGRDTSIAICDIDRFKLVNDTHGHAAGDAVLVEVATALRATLRESDFVARYGGEEFVILLPETAPLESAQALENVRRTVAGLDIRSGDHTLRVTLSFGLSGFGTGDDPDRVLGRADAALYRAKNSGRNRVAVYSDEDAVRA